MVHIGYLVPIVVPEKLQLSLSSSRRFGSLRRLLAALRLTQFIFKSLGYRLSLNCQTVIQPQNEPRILLRGSEFTIIFNSFMVNAQQRVTAVMSF